jgi:hypothetical protein
MLKRIARISTALVLAGILLTACGGGEEQDGEAGLPDTTTVPPTSDAAAAPDGTTAAEDAAPGEGTAVISPEPPPAPSGHFSLLTGLPRSEADVRKRPVGIMVGNTRAAMPTLGTSYADVIYECLVEGGVTRLLLIVEDFEDAASFGSIRSVREYYVDFTRAHDAVLVHGGGITPTYTFMNNLRLDRLDGVNAVFGRSFADIFTRDAARLAARIPYEHTMVISGAGIERGMTRSSHRTEVTEGFGGAFAFAPEPRDIGGEPAVRVSVRYSNIFTSEFTYNPDDGLYYRRQHGDYQVDGLNGERLRFENLIVMFARYTVIDFDPTVDYRACELVGRGTGYYFTRGRYIPITWERTDAGGVFTYRTADGSPLLLNPGRTMVCVPPIGQEAGFRVE